MAIAVVAPRLAEIPPGFRRKETDMQMQVWPLPVSTALRAGQAEACKAITRWVRHVRYAGVMSLILTLVVVLAVAPALAQERNPERNAYFGETHVHTSWSLDAWLFGNHLTDPGDAYKYFKGQPIKHPLGYEVKIETPLDWAGVTDHSEYVGVIRLANEPGSPLSKQLAAQPLDLKADTPAETQR